MPGRMLQEGYYRFLAETANTGQVGLLVAEFASLLYWESLDRGSPGAMSSSGQGNEALQFYQVPGHL